MADEAKPVDQGEDNRAKPEPQVPISRLNDVLAEVRTLRSELTAERQKREQPKPEKTYSRAELQAAVEARQISQAQMDAVLDNQQRQSIRTEVLAEVDQRARDQASAGELAAYQEKFPALLDVASEEFQAVNREFQSLVAMGLPESNATRLAAVKAALGPLSLARKFTPAKRPGFPEGGSGGEDRGGEKEGEMPARQREHYNKLIQMGRMTEAQVQEQWKRYSSKGKAA